MTEPRLAHFQSRKLPFLGGGRGGGVGEGAGGWRKGGRVIDR